MKPNPTTKTSRRVNTHQDGIVIPDLLPMTHAVRALTRGTDCTSTNGLVAPQYGADPDTNRSAGLHSFAVGWLVRATPHRVSRVHLLPV